MRAYYFDDLPGDQGLPHDSGIPVSNAALASIGVLVWNVPIPTSVASDFAQVDTIARERDYKTIDVMAVTKEALGELYEEKLKIFYSESVSFGLHGSPVLSITFSRHLHEDEEIRYVLEGGGFFDVHGKLVYHCQFL
jgi:1,2-dihydroxy-3-keto-5-methylthiopentene dioxygenase